MRKPLCHRDHVQVAETRTDNACITDTHHLESSVHPAHRRLNTCENMRLHGAGPRGILPSRPNGLAGSISLRPLFGLPRLDSFFESARITHSSALTPSRGLRKGSWAQSNQAPPRKGVVARHWAKVQAVYQAIGNEAANLVKTVKADPGPEGCHTGRNTIQAHRKWVTCSRISSQEQHGWRAVPCGLWHSLSRPEGGATGSRSACRLAGS